MKADQQSLARDLYFNTSKTQQEIADILDVNRRTVYLWIKQGRWDEMKAAARQMPSLILQNIYNLFTAVNDKIMQRDEDNRCPTMEEVEKLRKLLNMSNSIKKQHTGAYMEAFQELYQFIFNRDGVFAKELSGHIQAYSRGTMGDKEFIARRQRKQNVLDVTANLAKEEMTYDAQHFDSAVTPSAQQHRIADRQDNNATFCDKNDTLIGSCSFVPTAARAAIAINKACNMSGTSCDKTGSEKIAHEKQPEVAHSIKTEANAAFTNDHPAMQEMGEKCEENAIFCDKGTSAHPGPAEEPKPFRIKDHVGFPCPVDDEKYPIPSDFDFTTVSFLFDNKTEFSFDEVMKLPIAFRPSPFMDGDTVWVKEIDDADAPLNNFGLEWGTLKMGHTIRRYPDIDAAQAA